MQKERTSLLIQKIIDTTQGETITIERLAQSLGYRALGFLLFICAVPNIFLVILIPGSSLVLGILMIFLSIQLILRHQKLFLPQFILKKSISRQSLIHIVSKTSRYFEKFEKYIKPRYELFDRAFFQIILGCVCLLLSVIVAMPIFLSNFLPGIALTIISVGLIERDGLLIAIGMGFGILCGILILLIWMAIFNGAVDILHML